MPDKENVFSFSPGSSRRVDTRRLNPAKLRDARIAKRLNQSELAALVEVTRQAISSFEQGTKSPDSDTMIRLSDKLDQPLSYFVADDAPVFGEYSVRFMRAFGPQTKRRNLACDVLSKWLAQVAKYFDGFVNYPPVNVPSVGPSANDGRYEPEELEAAAEECRSRWGLGHGPIANVVKLIESHGIVTCRYQIPGERIEAFSFWSGDRPFIFLASDKDAACRSRFDVAHELGHLVLHRWIGPDELEEPKVLKLIEAEANRFAGAFLLPRKSFPAEVYTTRLDAFITLKLRWKVAIQAMIYRCKNLGLFDDDQITNLYKQISARRWKTREPYDDDQAAIPLEQPGLLSRAATMVLGSGRRGPDDVFSDLPNNRAVLEQLCNLPAGVLTSHPPEDFVPSLK